MAPVVKAKDLYKCYAGFAPVLRGVNIEVEPGEMVAIMGPSGCGKSTMLHILGLLHAPDAGTLEILDTNVLALNREQTAAFRRGNLGFVMQSSNLFEHSTVFENVEFPLIYENVPPQERWERVIRALDLVRLSARVHYRSNRLSGGEQQRVAIARAMVNNPRILMADEPTGALDARTSRLIMENFRTLCHNGGVSMIMVTHDPKMAEYCDSVYTLEEGVLVTRKREAPQVVAQSRNNFLKPPEPLARGALVAWRFPQKENYQLLELATRLYGLGLLSRIYAISPGNMLGNPEGYSLPLAVRRVSFLQNLLSLNILFRRARHSESLWSLWKRLPASRSFGLLARIRNFADGVYIARWGLQDNIQYFYAPTAGREATAAWVAAKLLRLPFIFAFSAKNLDNFIANYAVKANDSVFVVCSTKAEAAALKHAMPMLPENKILVAGNGLPVMPQEDEGDTSLPGQQVLPLNILAVDPLLAPRHFHTLLECCSLLRKRNVNFRLSITGPKTWGMRWKLMLKKLSRRTTFLGTAGIDRLGEIFRTADVLVAWPVAGEGLGLPWDVAEAMAYGLGIVAIDPGKGAREALIDGQNCLFAPPGDAAALAGIIARLDSGTALRKRLGERAKQDIASLLDTAASSRMLADRIVEVSALAERSAFAGSKVMTPPEI